MSAVPLGVRQAAVAIAVTSVPAWGAPVLGCEFSSATGAPTTSGTGQGDGASTSSGPGGEETSSGGGGPGTTTGDPRAETTGGAVGDTDGGDASGSSSSVTTLADDDGTTDGETGRGVVTSLYCDSPGVPIPDNDAGGAATQIVVPDAAVVLAVRVHLDVSHTHVGDLRFDLRHGEADRLIVSYPGGGGCSGDDIFARLTDDAQDSVQTACTADTPALSGDLLPEFSLDAFVGLAMLGAWELRATDGGPADMGTIDAWCLEIDHWS